VNHIADEVAGLCGNTCGLDASTIEELARAVERFVEQESGGANAVDSRYLVMLASRALSSLGEEIAACRLLLFGSDLVRPVEWEVTGRAAMWVLDLKRITVEDGAPLEMVLFRSLNIILEALAELWDSSEGSGILGLRHVSLSAAALLGGGARQRDVSSLGREIKAACLKKLEQLGERRRWTSAPQVLDLDI